MFAFRCIHVYSSLMFDCTRKLEICRASLLVGLIRNRPMKWALILNLLFFKVISVELRGIICKYLALGRKGAKKLYSLEFTFNLTLIEKCPS